MNTDTNHLMAEMTAEEMKRLEGYEPVPEHLTDQAKLELMGQKSVYVGINASGSLSKHMRYKRKKKLQQEKASRRKNRCYSK